MADFDAEEATAQSALALDDVGEDELAPMEKEVADKSVARNMRSQPAMGYKAPAEPPPGEAAPRDVSSTVTLEEPKPDTGKREAQEQRRAPVVIGKPPARRIEDQKQGLPLARKPPGEKLAYSRGPMIPVLAIALIFALLAALIWWLLG